MRLMLAYRTWFAPTFGAITMLGRLICIRQHGSCGLTLAFCVWPLRKGAIRDTMLRAA